MHKEKNKRKRDEVRVFRAPLTARIYQCVLLLPLILSGLLLVVNVKSIPDWFRLYPSGGIFDPIMLGIGALVLIGAYIVTRYMALKAYFVMRERYIIDADGIEFTIFGVSGFAPWEIVESLEVRNHRPGIVLSSGISPKRGRYRWPETRTGRYVWPETENLLDSVWTFIPLGYTPAGLPATDIEQLMRTPLGRALLDYAPYLFNDVKSKRGALHA